MVILLWTVRKNKYTKILYVLALLKAKKIICIRAQEIMQDWKAYWML